LRLARWTAERQARERLWHATNGCIAAGPFAGQRLGGTAAGDCEGPVLLGAYESETQDWLEREFARGWNIAVNVGSHVGVYSTGLAMRLRDATVYAFEMDEALRAETRRSADVNGVGARVQALGCATPELLASLPIPPGEGALVVCDCEGAERELMDPARVPWLVKSALCVELHDFAAPGATDALHARFAPSHDLLIVEQAPRDAATWASRAHIAVADAALLVNEGRLWGNVELPGRWLLASPRR
jgi:hypothetical protein